MPLFVDFSVPGNAPPQRLQRCRLATSLRHAASDAAVSITIAVQDTPQSTTRTGKDFYRELNYTNTSAAVSDTATITGTRSGPPVQTGTEQRPLFLPQTPESFDYDDDGNLTDDGRWIYTWDAENRLIAMETKVSIVTAFPGLKQKLDFAYDAQGRRSTGHAIPPPSLWALGSACARRGIRRI